MADDALRKNFVHQELSNIVRQPTLVLLLNGAAMSSGLRAVAEPEPASADLERSQPGTTWKQNEVHKIPHNNLKLVFPGLMLCVFLAALDQTIVAISLPAILSDIGGVGSGYSWVGTAYLLLAASFAPFYGKLSDVLGRKIVLFSAISIFLVGSALCGAAKSFVWLVIARGVQGLGGGGIFQLVQITVSDITPLETRGRYTGLIGAVWGFASIFGPLVGGVLTDHVSWRWIFYINLPTGAFATIILAVFLKLNPTRQKTLQQHMAEFDFLGLGLIMTGVVLLLLGFHEAETNWSARNTIIFVSFGAGSLILGAINEIFTTRSPIIPPRLFRTRTTIGILVSVFLHAFVYFGVTYYTPVYFQVLGASATKAGAQTIPFSCGGALVAIISGLVIVKTGSYRPVIFFGWFVMLLGQGLLILYDENTSVPTQEGLLLLLSIGAGCLFQPPLIALQAAMPLKDMATATATFGLIRQIGGTLAISVGGSIFASQAHTRLAELSTNINPRIIEDVRQISEIQPPELRHAVQHALTRSLATIWLIWTPLVAVGLLCVLPIRAYTLKRQVVKGEKGEKGESDDIPSSAPTDARVASRDAVDLERGELGAGELASNAPSKSNTTAETS
ncbi:MFS amino acid permease [Auriculariales sp. MPI-PUGE-AT-0066]|nr:MFS amino acid permease [Auriculariales sp. MPI-PUGE-AT-0066]